MKRILWIPHPTVIVLIRVFLGLIFFTAGMSKLYADHAFPGIIGPVWLEERLTEYGLGMYARFIAGSQIIAGLLLFTQRFATLGAILCFPIILNIFMVTLSMGWTGTPYVNLVLVMLNAWLLAYDYPKLKFILTDKTAEVRKIRLSRNNPSADRKWLLACLLILVSIPLSYVSKEMAWSIVAMSIIAIAIVQIRSRNLTT